MAPHQEHCGPLRTLSHILVVFALALGTRLYLWLSHPHVIFLHEADGIGYIRIARNIVENFSFDSAIHFPPFYPALIAAFSAVTVNYEVGARYASVFMGAGMAVPFYLACRYVMPARAALCAAVVASGFGPFVDSGVQPISQATYLGLISLGVWLGLCSTQKRHWLIFAAFGSVAAALYLTRPEGILFFAVNLPIMLYVIFRSEGLSANSIKCLGALSASYLIPLVWYIQLLHRVTGNWSIAGKSGVTAIGIDASMKLLPSGGTVGAAAANLGLLQMFPDATTFLKTFWQQTVKFSSVAISVLPAATLLIAATGLVMLVTETFARDRSDKKTALAERWLFLSPLVLLLPVMMFDKISPALGYIFPFFLVFIACCAKGLVLCESWIIKYLSRFVPLSPKVRQHMYLALGAAIFWVWLSVRPVYQWTGSEEFGFMAAQQDFLLRKTGYWFRDYTDKSVKIMARWSNIGYYGDRSWTGLVDGSIEQVTDYARRGNISYIVIDSDAVPRRRPQLEKLLYPEIPQPGLKPVYVDEQLGTRVIIYKVN